MDSTSHAIGDVSTQLTGWLLPSALALGAIAITLPALGGIATAAPVNCLESDAMLKAANVEMIGWDKAGSGMVTAFVRGDVAAVKAALDAGAEAAGRVGELIAAHVIARPHPDLLTGYGAGGGGGGD